MKKLITLIVVTLSLTFFIQDGITEEKKISEKSKEMADALAVLANMNPAIVMNVPSTLFGDYHCLHFTKGLTNMVHIAKDPAQYKNDLIMLVHAEPLILSTILCKFDITANWGAPFLQAVISS